MHYEVTAGVCLWRSLSRVAIIPSETRGVECAVARVGASAPPLLPFAREGDRASFERMSQATSSVEHERVQEQLLSRPWGVPLCPLPLTGGQSRQLVAAFQPRAEKQPQHTC